MRKLYYLYLFAMLFLFLDTGYSFLQFLGEPMDGDMADIILPSPRCSEVLDDPFGWSALTEQKTYVGPNRYFAHWLMSAYYKNVPILLQHFMDPMNSIYLATAIFKTATHLLFIWMLVLYSGLTLKLKGRQLLYLAILIIPLLQTYGYNRSMGLMMHSPTYTFFYSFPIALLLLFFFPFWRKLHEENYQISNLWMILCFVLMLVLNFNGPLINPLVLIICPGILLYLFWSNLKSISEQNLFQNIKTSLLKIPPQILIPFSTFTLLSLYSFYIGTFNIEGITAESLLDRFAKIPLGLFDQLTRKIGFPLLLGFLITNFILIKKTPNNTITKSIIQHGKWISLFSLIYILLLPFGGYRSYRPNILRTDTILPITIALFYLFISSSYLIATLLQKKQKWFYVGTLTTLLLIFTIADEPNFDYNNCERELLTRISETETELTYLPPTCSVLGWRLAAWSGDTKYNGILLKYWNITEEERRWVQKQKSK
ncbi:MAG: hypothetical protein AB8F74_10590 [Saprospiraceae bacterium]